MLLTKKILFYFPALINLKMKERLYDVRWKTIAIRKYLTSRCTL